MSSNTRLSRRLARFTVLLLALFYGGIPAQAQPALTALIGFRTNSAVVAETDGMITVRIYRAGYDQATNIVRLQINSSVGGVADPIAPSTRNLTFLPGDIELGVDLPINDNLLRGTNRPAQLSLSAITPRTVITNRYNSMSIVIPDDDGMIFRLGTNAYAFRETDPNPMVSIHREGNSGIAASVNLRLAHPNSAPTVRPILYTLLTQRVDFAISETQQMVRLPLVPARAITGPSAARLLLESPSTPLAALASPSNATLSILDVDGGLTLRSNRWIQPGSSSASIVISRVGGTNAIGSGFLALEDGTARAGEDFTGGRFPFEFLDGTVQVTVEVPLLDNPARTHGRWFKAVLQQAEPLDVVDPAVIVWIPPSTASTQPRLSVDAAANFAGIPTNLSVILPGSGNTWILGGTFPPVPGSTVSNVVRIRRGAGLDPSWQPTSSPDGPILHGGVFPDGRVLLGGNFTVWGDTPRSRLALIDIDGSIVPTGTTLDVDLVTGIATDPRGRIYLSGTFANLGSSALPGLARFAPDASVDSTFNPPAWLAGGITGFAPLHPGGAVVTRPNLTALILDDAGSSNATASFPLNPGGTPRITTFPDGSARLGRPEIHLLPGGAVNPRSNPEFAATERTWFTPSGSVYASSRSGPGWKLTRHWSDGTPDPRVEVWFDGAVTLLAEASDGAILVSGSFKAADGIAAKGIAQLIPPPPATGVRWHSGDVGHGVGETAGTFAIPAWRETGLESSLEIPIALPDAPALAEGKPASALLRFEAGSRLGWLPIPLRNRTEAGPDDFVELALPAGELVSGAPALTRVEVFRDEQLFSFYPRTVVMTEDLRAPITTTDPAFYPNLQIRRLAGFGYTGSTYARFTGGTVRAHIGPFHPFAPYPAGADFFAHTGVIPAGFFPGVREVSLYVGPLDDRLSQGDRTATFRLDGPSLPGDDEATLIVRDNDVYGPARSAGLYAGYQVLPGIPFLLRYASSVDGAFLPGPQPLADDGSPVGGFVAPQGGNSLAYGGPGPNGSHYYMEVSIPPTFSRNPRLVRHLASGQPDPSFAPITFAPSIQSDAIDAPFTRSTDGSLFVVTRQTGVQIGGSPFAWTHRVARYQFDGTIDPTYAGEVYLPNRRSPGFAGTPPGHLLPHRDGSLLIVAGNALSADGVRRDLILLGQTGNSTNPFRAQVSRDDRFGIAFNQALRDDEGRCILWGNFERVDGVLRSGFARLTTHGRVDPSFEPRFLNAYPPGALINFCTRPGSKLFVVFRTPSGSVGRIVTAAGDLDPSSPTIAFKGVARGGVTRSDGGLLVQGEFIEVDGQARMGEAWFDPELRLLGTAPLAMELRSVGDATRIVLDARAAGPVRVERGPFNGPWEAAGEWNLQPGRTEVEIPTPVGESWYLRAVRP